MESPVIADAVDVLAVGAHPDDVELGAGGTICSITARGYRVAIVDLTQGELGSRGTVAGRRHEAEAAARVMKVEERVNLAIPDGNIENNEDNRLLVIREIRRLRPRIMLVGAEICRHPDHRAATELAVAAAFFAGLRRIEVPDLDGTLLKPHRPDHVLHYMQAVSFEPTLLVDVSDFWDRKIEAIRAFESQFFNPDYEPSAEEPDTYVSNRDFFEWIEARARAWGYPIGARYAEPFLYRHGPVGVDDLMTVVARTRTFR